MDNIPAVENITHSLLGATLAELALPATATRSQRRVFFTVGIVASNLPDLDLLYTSISAPPIGYLLHHRGHTHTLVGLVGLGLLVAAVCALPAIGRRVADLRPRLWALIAASLLSHIVLDSWNSYGVHPFWPLNNRWFYGDAIFIVELWFWIFLGSALFVNSRRRRTGRTTSWSAHRRSATALGAMVLFVAMMFGLRTIAEARVHDAERPVQGDMVDVVLSPQPANPFCWSVLSIVRNEAAAEYTLTRATASVTPRWTGINGCGGGNRGEVAWDVPVRQSLPRLRALSRDDCWVRAWLQFGRAPLLDETSISDMRYSDIGRSNFSTMVLPPAGTACPVNLTNWTMPRADLLE